MLQVSPTAISLAAVAAVMATVASAAIGFDGRATAQRGQTVLAHAAGPVQASKVDRVHTPRPPQARTAVAVVELVGVSDTMIVLKDRTGAVLYRSDPQTNTTTVTKNADVPVVTVKERVDSPVRAIREPEPSSEPKPAKRKPLPVGCEAVVSALVASNQPRTPSLCLADAGTRQPS